MHLRGYQVTLELRALLHPEWGEEVVPTPTELRGDRPLVIVFISALAWVTVIPRPPALIQYEYHPPVLFLVRLPRVSHELSVTPKGKTKKRGG